MDVQEGARLDAVMDHIPALRGRDLEFKAGDRTYRGPIETIKIHRSGNMLMGIVIQLGWSAEKTPVTGNQWVNPGDTQRRQFVFDTLDLKEPLKQAADGTIVCQFPKHELMIKPAGDNLIQGNIMVHKRY